MYCEDDDIYSILIYDAHHAYNVDDEHSMHIMMMIECFVQGVIHRPDETILTAVNEQ